MQRLGGGVCAAQRYPGYAGSHIPLGRLEIAQLFWSRHLSLPVLRGRSSSICFTRTISAGMHFLFCVCTAASSRGLASPHHCSQWEVCSVWLLKHLYLPQEEREKKISPKTPLLVTSFVTGSSTWDLLPFQSTNITSIHFQPMIIKCDK